MSRHYWWALPVLFFGFWSIAYLRYNLQPTLSTFNLQRIVGGFSVLFTLPIILVFLISFPIFIAKLLKGKILSEPFKLLVSTPLIFIAFVYVTQDVQNGLSKPIFDPLMKSQKFAVQNWNDKTTHKRNMTADLVTNILPGKTCEEIEEILGPSLDENYAKGPSTFKCKKGEESELRYYLGSLGIWSDIDNLHLFFDESGLYSEFRIHNYDW